jgi:ketosteroid isomerase-like protein
MTRPPAFLQRHIDLISAKDLEGLMARYHPDAILLRPGVGMARGQDEIRKLFTGYLEMNPQIEPVFMSEGTEDLYTYYAHVTTDRGEQDDVGTMVLRDGLVWRQTAFAVSAP